MQALSVKSLHFSNHADLFVFVQRKAPAAAWTILILIVFGHFVNRSFGVSRVKPCQCKFVQLRVSASATSDIIEYLVSTLGII